MSRTIFSIKVPQLWFSIQREEPANFHSSTRWYTCISATGKASSTQKHSKNVMWNLIESYILERIVRDHKGSTSTIVCLWYPLDFFSMWNGSLHFQKSMHIHFWTSNSYGDKFLASKFRQIETKREKIPIRIFVSLEGIYVRSQSSLNTTRFQLECVCYRTM